MVNFFHAYPYHGGNCNCFLSHIARWFPIANNLQEFLYTLFCPLILDHGVLLKISVSGPKVLVLLVFTVHSATHLALSTIQFHAHNNNKELAL